MAAQSARLVGLLILSFELRQLGISRWESIVFWIWLGIGMGTVADFRCKQNAYLPSCSFRFRDKCDKHRDNRVIHHPLLVVITAANLIFFAELSNDLSFLFATVDSIYFY